MAVKINEEPVEAHQSARFFERYHGSLRRQYHIIMGEMKGASIDKIISLQMAVKAVNDTAGSNGLVPK